MNGDAAALLERLRAALAGRPSRAAVVPASFRPAAVLIPLLERPEGPTVLVTLRPGAMRSHAGQVAFPGGKLDEGDADLAACALREAEEEVGLPRAAVEILGLLDQVPTPSGYVITPAVGLVRAPPPLVPNREEVEAMFEVPLAVLSGPGAYFHQGVQEWMGIRYEMHAYRHGELVIWGATARMLWQLLGLVGG